MKIIHIFLSWLITLLLPLALTFLGLRLLLTHAFPEIEYRLPGFPRDDYGFNLQDRLKWSEISIDYLTNNANISFLGSLAFPDGTSLYNERELSHMRDVKNIIKPVLWIGYGDLILLIGLGLWARYGGWWKPYLRGLWRGGILILGLIFLLGIFASLNFWQFFTEFHGLFFTGDTWQFLFSDTLIRLFPLRFWQDAFIFVGIVDLVGSTALVAGLLSKRK
jgi:integral membrane protein (TIGR01906 family)